MLRAGGERAAARAGKSGPYHFSATLTQNPGGPLQKRESLLLLKKKLNFV
jgi:hypothetical protein